MHHNGFSLQQNICQALSIKSMTDLSLYLGMPTITSRVTKEPLITFCEKIDRRLSGWKTKYLSLAAEILWKF